MPVIRDTIKNEAGAEVAIYVEVDEQTQPIVGRRTDINNPYADTRGVPQQVGTAFNGALDLVRTCAEQAARTIASIAPELRPSACEIQFGVKVDAELGAIIGKASTEAQFQVTLVWGDTQNAPHS